MLAFYFIRLVGKINPATVVRSRIVAPCVPSATRAILDYHRSTLERSRLEGVSVYQVSVYQNDDFA